MECLYISPIFSISSQIIDSWRIMPFESAMRRTQRATIEIELDLGRYELRRQGQRVKLEKKPMELLIFLVSRREQLVSRQEIVRKLWGSDLFLDTETNINNIVRKIRSALDDDSARPRFLETVVGKGYRFVGPVRVLDVRHSQSDFGLGAGRVTVQEEASGRSGRTSLAVLPLMLLGKVTDDDGVCLGFADALVVRLGNLSGVDVLPTSAVVSLPAGATPADAAAQLGVRFVVHGGIQIFKGLWRLSLEMFDTHLQSVCFRRKRDLDLNRLSDLEDEIAKQIAMALNRPLGPIMVQRSARYSKDPMAYAAFMRAYKLNSSGKPAMLDEVTRHLSDAVARDPTFSLCTPLFPWPARLVTLNLIHRAHGWRRPSFIVAARWSLIRICLKGTSHARFFFGGPPETSSIGRQLTNSNARCSCRTISPRRTTAWGPSWLT